MADETPQGIPSPFIHTGSPLPPEVTEEIATLLMPTLEPLLNRFADLARKYGMDYTFNARNGMQFCFRASAWVEGGKGRTVAAIDFLLDHFDECTLEEVKQGIVSMRGAIVNNT